MLYYSDTYQDKKYNYLGASVFNENNKCGLAVIISRKIDSDVIDSVFLKIHDDNYNNQFYEVGLDYDSELEDALINLKDVYEEIGRCTDKHSEKINKNVFIESTDQTFTIKLLKKNNSKYNFWKSIKIDAFHPFGMALINVYDLIASKAINRLLKDNYQLNLEFAKYKKVKVPIKYFTENEKD